MLTIKEAKERRLIPEKFWDLIPELCYDCGKPIETTENLKLQRCVDPRCIAKLSARGAAMLQSLGIKGIGKEYCRRYLETMGSVSHLTLLVGEEKDYLVKGMRANGAKLYRAVQDIRNTRSFTFPSLVQLLSLPGLDRNAERIFKGVQSYEAWLKKIESVGHTKESYIASLPGFGWTSAQDITWTLNNFELELKQVTGVFRVKHEALIQYNIAITGAVTKIGLAFNRTDFGRYLNHLGEGYVSVRIGKSLWSCDYIIADNCSPDDYQMSPTYQAGLARKERGETDVLITSDKMVEIVKADVAKIKELIEQWYKQNNQQSEPITS